MCSASVPVAPGSVRRVSQPYEGVIKPIAPVANLRILLRGEHRCPCRSQSWERARSPVVCPQRRKSPSWTTPGLMWPSGERLLVPCVVRGPPLPTGSSRCGWRWRFLCFSFRSRCCSQRCRNHLALKPAAVWSGPSSAKAYSSMPAARALSQAIAHSFGQVYSPSTTLRNEAGDSLSQIFVASPPSSWTKQGLQWYAKRLVSLVQARSQLPCLRGVGTLEGHPRAPHSRWHPGTDGGGRP